MNLFETIGLTADPFSTSPNVDLFYPAVEHRQCLEGLELAIRMKRGLSVVKGGIGVGKTTISRKLIQNFQNEIDDFTFHLILDPKIIFRIFKKDGNDVLIESGLYTFHFPPNVRAAIVHKAITL